MQPLWIFVVSIISPKIDLFLIKGVVVFIVFITFKKDEKKFRQIAMDEKEQEKSEMPPLLGTKEVKESGELEKEDWKIAWFNSQIVPFIDMFL